MTTTTASPDSAGATGVLLLNLGGPDRPEDIRPFLVNLFSDRRIIRLGPALMQPLIARLIARRRAPKSAANYARMSGWHGGSPQLTRTKEQARTLEARLTELAPDKGPFLVRPCMRYWHPFAREVLAELSAHPQGLRRLIVLPLYPQYSVATTGSSVADLERALATLSPMLPLRVIRSWPDQPDYIAALEERVQEALAQFPHADAGTAGATRLLYSAHSLPKKFVDEGDPYVDDLKKTIAALEARTGVQGHLCYQSRSGPVEWLAPSTPEAIRQAAAEGARNLVVLPISFVSDHIETLVELDMDYRALAEGLGMRYVVTRPLNDDTRFIEGLAKLVSAAL